jgi:metal-dependent amidase/aminoacylase/carboxypeptidase family protein
MVSIADFDPLLSELIAWRHDFHAHPELTFDVHRTAALVAERLSAMGVDEVVTGIGKTGVVGVIRGAATASGRVIGLAHARLRSRWPYDNVVGHGAVSV